MKNSPLRDRIAEAIERGEDLDTEALTDRVMATLEHLPITVTLAMVSRVEALEDALRRLSDAAAPIADHVGVYPPGCVEVVLNARRIGSDDAVYPVTVQGLKELDEAVIQAEEAFWPAQSVDLAPELARAP